MDAVDLDFQQIHDEYRPKILRYLTRLVGEFEAEDLTQEVLLKISKALPTFRGEAKVSTWIYRIATNTAVDKLRQPAFRYINKGNGMEAVGEAVENDRDGIDLTIKDEACSLEQQLFQKQRLECYIDFIKQLPLNYRVVVALSELGEFAIGEIADILGLSREVVKIRLHRGRLRLLKELKAHCKVEDWL